MDIKLAVKYCGGCNPIYNRKEVVDTICYELDICWVLYDEENIPDVTLIVCGCSAECIKLESYKSRYRTFLINSPEQVQEAIDMIKSIKAE